MFNIIDQKKYNKIIKKYRAYLKEKMGSINDTFPESTWYLENWINNRKIERTATLNPSLS